MTAPPAPVALVTGTSTGIGFATALRLARAGHRVKATMRNLAKSGPLEAAAKAEGLPLEIGELEVTDQSSIDRAVAEVLGAYGAVDVLVNNAGIVSGRSFLELPDAKIEATFAINTLSLFWVTKAFLPQMIEQRRGHVVTIASASALVGVARLADYAASKWAAMGFEESLRVELRQIAPAIRTTVVCPYYIDTGMFRGVKSRFPWLLPILDENDVAARIVRAIQRDERRLLMPWAVHLLPLLRLLPVGVFDQVSTFLGVNASMDAFQGRGESQRSDS